MLQALYATFTTAPPAELLWMAVFYAYAAIGRLSMRTASNSVFGAALDAFGTVSSILALLAGHVMLAVGLSRLVGLIG